METKQTWLPKDRSLKTKARVLRPKTVSPLSMANLRVELDFIESSALTASNVETAFFKLISNINDKVQSGFYQDRLETFNYFGSA